MEGAWEGGGVVRGGWCCYKRVSGWVERAGIASCILCDILFGPLGASILARGAQLSELEWRYVFGRRVVRILTTLSASHVPSNWYRSPCELAGLTKDSRYSVRTRTRVTPGT